MNIRTSPIKNSLLLLLIALTGCELQGMKKQSAALSISASTQQSTASGFSTYKSTVYALVTGQCATCHKSTQTPFIADDDASAAYSVTKTLVSWNNLSNSTLLAKIDDGHCGPSCSGPYTQAMANALSSWMAAEGIVATSPTPSGTATPTPTPSPSGTTSPIIVYQNTVFPIVTNNCSGCHAGAQTPFFAVNNINNSYSAAKTVVSFSAPATSKLYTQSMNGHCGQMVCMTDGTAMLNAIQTWARAEGF